MINTFLLLLSKFSLSRLFNSFCLRISYLFSVLVRKPFVCGWPEAASYELSSVCNLNCPECPAGQRKINRERNFPDKSTYIDFLNEARNKLWYMLLYFQGEPFMNPDWSFFVREASKRRIYTAISTNGHFLDGKNIELIFRTGLDEIIISVDGVTQEEYEKYRKGGNLNTVLSGIEKLVSAKKNNGSLKPVITLQFIVFSHNEHSVDVFKKMAKNTGADRIEIKTAQLEDLSNTGLLPLNDKYRRYNVVNDKAVLKKKIKNRCWRMWHSFVVTSDAKVVPCCFDKYAEHTMGTLSNSTVEEIWFSQKYYEFRGKIFNNRTSVAMCRNCVE